MTWRRVLVAAALWAAATSVVPSAPAHALECPDGIIVVVDPGPLGGGVTSRCVTTSPSNGVQALRDAGHRVDFVPGQPGFVCQIDVRPDPCNRAPVHAHWSYWYADQGGTWRYSNVGAGDASTPRSNVEGWRFGDGSSPPSIPPPDGKPAPEPKPEPKPDPEPEPKPEPREDTSSSGDSTGGSSSGSSSTGGSSSGGSSSESSTGSSSTAPSPSTSSENGSTDQAPSDEETSGEPDTEDPEPFREPDRSGLRNQLRERVELSERTTPPSADEPETDEDDPDSDEDDDRAADEVVLPDRDDSGPPVGLITGGGLLAGLATLTALQVRRRRDLEG